jgi:hypothetical protein
MTLTSCRGTSQIGSNDNASMGEPYNSFHCVNRHPSFTGILIPVLIVARSMLRSPVSYQIAVDNKCTYQDGDANHTVGINCMLGSDYRYEKYTRGLLLGCHMGVMNRIFGGCKGYSEGKVNRALKNPPSLDPVMIRIIIREGMGGDVLWSVWRPVTSIQHDEWLGKVLALTR